MQTWSYNKFYFKKNFFKPDPSFANNRKKSQKKHAYQSLKDTRMAVIFTLLNNNLII